LLIYSYASLLSPKTWSQVFEGQKSKFSTEAKNRVLSSTFDDTVQILSLVFVLTHVMAEVDQIIRVMHVWSSDEVIRAIAQWWDSHWNKWDLFMYIIILLGMIAKFPEETFFQSISRVLLAIGALLLWMRSLRFFAKSPTLGPKTLSMCVTFCAPFLRVIFIFNSSSLHHPPQSASCIAMLIIASLLRRIASTVNIFNYGSPFLRILST
jgi:hypothetical protein